MPGGDAAAARPERFVALLHQPAGRAGRRGQVASAGGIWYNRECPRALQRQALHRESICAGGVPRVARAAGCARCRGEVDMAITAAGSMALDKITTSAGTHEDVLGGSLTYFSLAASLFAPVHLVAVIGDDFPPRYLSWFAGRPILLEGL